MYMAYSKVAPRVGDWPVLMTKLAEMLRRDYDWSEEVARIKAPTLIVVGDSDSVRPAHAVEFFGLLGGGKRDGGWDGSGMPQSRLAILPGTTHYTIFSSPMLASLAEAFLDAPVPSARESASQRASDPLRLRRTQPYR
jgi:pimeloyl-ACP methyl ester carboxylesterase